MTPERWLRLEELFSRLESLSAEKRGPLLDRECADDPDLRRRLERMLAQLDLDETRDWIGSSIHNFLPSPQDQIPERLGRYRVTGEIGRGGLAIVLAAERDDQEFQQKVAIKLIRRGLDTDDLLDRLRQERQILARFRHPNIATLIDGGSTDDGRPFVVMEHIDGRPIDEYCANLTLHRRLNLFVEVCDAVQYAHRNLVIHRDIKPANILVTAEGCPKLLDFGIAKVLQPSAQNTQGPAPTVPGLRLLTPEYASPEHLRGEPLTTATDVYSLGVLLFELLTDERPHSLLLGDPRALEATIRESPVQRPSSRVRRRGNPIDCQGSPAAEQSKEGRDSRVQLAKALQGDLDNIVLMALRPEPDRRYGSVEQLADDVRRYLGDLPVRARADTISYRLSKFVRRHRLTVVIAAMAIIALIALSLVTLRQAHLADQGRLASDRLSEMLVTLFELPDPGDERGQTVTALEILERGTDQIGQLQGQPTAQARFLNTMGRVYNNLGLHDRAETALAQAVDLRRQAGSAPDLADSLNHLGEAQYLQGKFDSAEACFRESFDLRLESLGRESPALAESLTNLGVMSLMRQDLDQAERLLFQALELRQKPLGEQIELAKLHENLASLRQLQGRHEDAEQHLRKALGLHTRFHGDGHYQTASTMANLASLLHRGGDLAAAEPLYRQAREGQLAALGAAHPQVAKTTSDLGALLIRKGDQTEGEDLLRQAMASLGESLGPDHFQVTYPMIHLADLLAGGDPSRRAEARRLYDQVHHIRSRSLPAGHSHQISPLLGAARLALRELRHDDAAKAAAKAYDLSRRIHGPEHRATREAQKLQQRSSLAGSDNLN